MSSAPTDPSLAVSSIAPNSSPSIENTPSETVQQTAQLAAKRLGLESSAHPQEIAPSQEKVEAFLHQESAASSETVPNPPVQAMVATVSETKGEQELQAQAEELLEDSQATASDPASDALVPKQEEDFVQKMIRFGQDPSNDPLRNQNITTLDEYFQKMEGRTYIPPPDTAPDGYEEFWNVYNAYTEQFNLLASFVQQEEARKSQKTLLPPPNPIRTKEELLDRLRKTMDYNLVDPRNISPFRKYLLEEYNQYTLKKNTIELVDSLKKLQYIPQDIDLHTISSKEQLFDLLAKETKDNTIPSEGFSGYPLQIIEEYNNIQREKKLKLWRHLAEEKGLISPETSLPPGCSPENLLDALVANAKNYDLLPFSVWLPEQEYEFCIGYNRKIHAALLKDLLSLGVKPPKNYQASASDLFSSGREKLLQQMAIRNCYGEIPADPTRSEKLKLAAALYEQYTAPLREAYLRMQVTCNVIKKITKRGLIQTLFIKLEGELGSGGAKTVRELHTYKPCFTKGYSLLLKQKALALVSKEIVDVPTKDIVQKIMASESLVSNTLRQKKVPYILLGRNISLLDPSGNFIQSGIYMEKCWGSCIELLQKHPVADLNKAIFSLEIARSVRGLHQAGFVHRDLKLDNVLLKTGSGKETEIRLTDFGMTVPEGMTIPITGTWIAPEQAQELLAGNKKECTTCTSDLWSLGVSLWGMRHSSLDLVLSRPVHIRSVWTASGTASAADIQGKFQEVSKEARDVAEQTKEDIDVLIADLLSCDPAARPSAEQVVARLEQYMQSKGYPIPPMPT